MAQKKKYKIYCETEGDWIYSTTISDNIPTVCPNDAGHTVTNDTNIIEEIIELDNLAATTDPTINDDVNNGYVVGSKWFNNTTRKGFICLDNASGVAAWRESARIFGTEYFYNEREIESSTSGNDFIEKLKLATPLIPAGDYQISWQIQMKGNASGKDFEYRVELDNTIVLGSFIRSDNKYNLYSGFSRQTLSSGIHEIDIDFKCAVDNMTAYIKNSRIDIRRVG